MTGVSGGTRAESRISGDRTEELAAAVRDAWEHRRPLRIVAGNSKAFYGRAVDGETLSLTEHTGILNYEPSELVVTARAGTPLRQLNAVLNQCGQCLPFEPPQFSAHSTIGGAVAAGLAGPARPFTGAVRDYLLGVRCINGRGEVLRFGGEVMKNVAGFDVSRLLAGSQGTLAVILDVSIKVLPLPAAEQTWVLEGAEAAAIERMNHWAGRPIPLTGAVHLDGRTCLRLAGTLAGVGSAARALGGTALQDANFWTAVRDQSSAFFAGDAPLLRVVVPSATSPLAVDAPVMLDWGGGQRWVRTSPDDDVRRQVAEAGGYLEVFRGAVDGQVFSPLSPRLAALHRRLKARFDPRGILNPGRLYDDL